MQALREDYLAVSVKDERISAREIVRQHQASIESLARPTFGRLFWGPVWFIGEAPKGSHVVACQTFSRLSNVWDRLQLRSPVEFRDLTEQPMPKSYTRWGDVRPRLMDAALGARRILREALGLSGTATSDLFVVLLGSTVRAAFGAQRLELYRWYSLPRSGTAFGELFLATIPHPSPLASRAFDERRVAHLLAELHYARVRRPTRARGYQQLDGLPLMPLES